MADSPIATYLQDHLAGAVAALELLQHLEEAHAGSDTGRFVSALRADVAADRAELEALMERLGVAASGPRKAMAWLAEKLTQAKLRLEDEGGGNLRLLEALDSLAGGIEAKGALWQALAAASERAPALRGVDYGRLTARAEEQRRRLEPRRLDAARAVLGVDDARHPTPPAPEVVPKRDERADAARQ